MRWHWLLIVGSVLGCDAKPKSTEPSDLVASDAVSVEQPSDPTEEASPSPSPAPQQSPAPEESQASEEVPATKEEPEPPPNKVASEDEMVDFDREHFEKLHASFFEVWCLSAWLGRESELAWESSAGPDAKKRAAAFHRMFAKRIEQWGVEFLAENPGILTRSLLARHVVEFRGAVEQLSHAYQKDDTREAIKAGALMSIIEKKVDKYASKRLGTAPTPFSEGRCEILEREPNAWLEAELGG